MTPRLFYMNDEDVTRRHAQTHLADRSDTRTSVPPLPHLIRSTSLNSKWPVNLYGCVNLTTTGRLAEHMVPALLASFSCVTSPSNPEAQTTASATLVSLSVA
jgi:hypothetical protein